MKKVMFISSTGGHLNELLQLEPIFEDFDYSIVTEKDRTTKALKNKYSNKTDYLLFGTKDQIISYMIKFPINIIKSFAIFIKRRPEVIVTTGTHTAVPMCYLAKIFGKKIIYIETMANSETATLAGKIIYPIADLFIVQWESMLEIYPNAEYWGWLY